VDGIHQERSKAVTLRGVYFCAGYSTGT